MSALRIFGDCNFELHIFCGCVLDVNGWSNLYYGWGGEDDDFYLRFKRAKKNIKRSSGELGKYDLSHHHEANDTERNSKRWMLLEMAERGQLKRDGLRFSALSVN